MVTVGDWVVMTGECREEWHPEVEDRPYYILEINEAGTHIVLAGDPQRRWHVSWWQPVMHPFLEEI